MPTTTKLNFGQLQSLWESAGGPKGVSGMAAAIALVESNGDPQAWNNCPRYNNRAKCLPGDKEDSRGLWQINLDAHPEFKGWNMFNAQTNAQAAVQLYHSDGFGPWQSDIDSGKVNQYLGGNPAKSQTCQLPANTATLILNKFKKDGDWGTCLESCKAFSRLPTQKERDQCCVSFCGGTIGKGGAGVFNVGPPQDCSIGGLVSLPSWICNLPQEIGYAFTIMGGGILILIGLILLGVDLGLSGGKNVPVINAATRVSRARSERRIARNTERSSNQSYSEGFRMGQNYQDEKVARRADRTAARREFNRRGTITKKQPPKQDFGEVPF